MFEIDVTVAPDFLLERVARDDLAAARHEQRQRPECVLADLDGLAGLGESAVRGVYFKTRETSTGCAVS